MHPELRRRAHQFGILFLALSGTSILFESPSEGAPVERDTFVKLARKVGPSVVNILKFSEVKSTATQGKQKLYDDFWKQYESEMRQKYRKRFQAPKDKPKLKAVGVGTGFIIDKTGYIITNDHVIENAARLHVFFTNQDREAPVPARVIGRDPDLDLALLKIKTSRPIQALSLGDSDRARVGEFVIAMGNPYGHRHTVTHGILSAKGRTSPSVPLTQLFQTDCPINPGNSGGPLINLKGEVIAVNSSLDIRAQGIGFAIPINTLKAILPQLKSKGYVQRGFIGLNIEDLDPDIAQKLKVPERITGPIITEVYDKKPAKMAGLQLYDVFVTLNNEAIRSKEDLFLAVTRAPVDREVEVTLFRNGETIVKNIQVGEREVPEQIKNLRNTPPPPQSRKGLLYIGMKLQSTKQGLKVLHVDAPGPAQHARLEPGDLILKVDQKGIVSENGFRAQLKQNSIHSLEVIRRQPKKADRSMILFLDLR